MFDTVSLKNMHLHYILHAIAMHIACNKAYLSLIHKINMHALEYSLVFRAEYYKSCKI